MDPLRSTVQSDENSLDRDQQGQTEGVCRRKKEEVEKEVNF